MGEPVSIPTGLIDRLYRVQRVVALTGAGISAESGVPTFRDALTGLWAEDLATEPFERDPKLVWKWYEWRRGIVAKAQPNPGHSARADFSLRGPAGKVLPALVNAIVSASRA